MLISENILHLIGSNIFPKHLRPLQALFYHVIINALSVIAGNCQNLAVIT